MVSVVSGREIESVGVVGCGQMGAGIAEVFARSGFHVLVIESNKVAVDRGKERLSNSLTKAQTKGRVASARQVMSHLHFSDDLKALAGSELVIEAIPEDERLKLDLFSSLDRLIQSDSAILASNTSSIPIMKLAAVTSRPSHVLGMHFFNPVPVLPLTELIPSLFTSPETLEVARQIVEKKLSKQAIVSQDRAGFIVNSLLIPFILSAIRMLESGFATADDIDRGMVAGCAHPQGPLALADLIGLDTTKSVADSLYAEFKEPLYAPPPILARMVEAGLLGRKSGRGFFTY